MCRYPGTEELLEYFGHVEKEVEIKKDTALNTHVVGVQFDEPLGKWKVETEDGQTAACNCFLLALGFSAKRHFLDWSGIDRFKGDIHHSSF